MPRGGDYLLGIEPQILEVEVTDDALCDLYRDDALASELDQCPPLGFDQLTAEALVRGLLLFVAAVLVEVSSSESTVSERIEAAQAFGRVWRDPVLLDELLQPGQSGFGGSVSSSTASSNGLAGSGAS